MSVFKKGDRVRLTKYGHACIKGQRQRFTAIGVVTATPQDGKPWVMVRRDGYKCPIQFSQEFWEVIPEAEAGGVKE